MAESPDEGRIISATWLTVGSSRWPSWISYPREYPLFTFSMILTIHFWAWVTTARCGRLVLFRNSGKKIRAWSGTTWVSSNHKRNYRPIKVVGGGEHLICHVYFYVPGFYIHTCPKMSYKSHFRPAELLDPVTYDWYAIQDCLPPLEHSRYVVFSMLALTPTTRGDLPGQLDPDRVQISNFDNIRFRIHQRTFPASRVMQVAFQDPRERQQFIDKLQLYVAAVGPTLASKLIILSWPVTNSMPGKKKKRTINCTSNNSNKGTTLLLI